MKIVFNKGQREIHTASGILYPQKSMQLENNVADGLKKLYANELIDFENTGAEELDAARKEIEYLKEEIDLLNDEIKSLQSKISEKSSKPGKKG